MHDGSFFPSTVYLWNKLPPHIVNIVIVEQFSDHVSNLFFLQMCTQLLLPHHAHSNIALIVRCKQQLINNSLLYRITMELLV